MIRSARLLGTVLASAALTALFTLTASAAPVGAGAISADALRLRATPDTEGEILATVSTGESVVVLENEVDGWYKVSYNTVEGYMSAEYLEVSAAAEADLGYGKVTAGGSPLTLRGWAGTEYDKLASIPDGTVLALEGICDGWYKVTYAGKSGYVSGDYITLTDEPSSTASGLGAELVAYAEQFLGAPYAWGGNGPSSFDCSGFVKYVYANFGYTLNRTATAQLDNGVAVSREELQPGDLVFFRYQTSKPVSHVGIYVGDGMFIHASTTGVGVVYDQINYGHYDQYYVYGRRIL